MLSTVVRLAGEIGVGKRQAQKYLAELEREKLIRRRSRFAGPGQTSNDIEFLWHSLFEAGVNDRSGEGVNDSSPGGVNDRSPKESQIQESHPEESHNGDLDYPPTNRKNRDSRLDVASLRVGCRQYPQLREALADYMTIEGEAEHPYPSDRHVVDVVDAAEGATEEDVIQCLGHLYRERGLRPGTKHGPRHFSWFKTVVADYFLQKRDRDLVVNRGTHGAWEKGTITGLSRADFDSMTDAIEIEGPP